MKNRNHRPVYLILLAFFAAAAVLLVILLTDTGSNRHEANIVLPGHDSETEHAGDIVIPRESVETGERIRVDARNVLSVIGAMKRPESYYLEIETAVYSGDASRTAQIRHWVNGDTSMTRRSEEGETPLYIMRTQDSVRLWYENSGDSYTGSLSEYTGDDAAGIKTYEDLLAEPGEIVSALYTQFEGYNCIYVLARDRELGYLTDYYIDVDSGLLVGCNTKKTGETVYTMTVTAIGDDISGMDKLFE